MGFLKRIATLDALQIMIVLVNFIGCRNISRVTVRQGLLSGFVDYAEGGKEFVSFLGIPYAKPPIGRLRFQDPVLHLGWKGEFNAGSFGAECAQWNVDSQSFIGREDCLTLNVYTPQKSTGTQSNLLPVMFYVHGGAYKEGSSQSFGPAKLMSNGSVVLVSINYRLTALGFLSTGDSVAAGNYGMLDMIMALKWTRDNIKQFGGDPQRVTIFGNSAGGAAVSILTLSPLAQGLFHAVITQSGNAVMSWAITKKPQKYAKEFATLLDCDVTDSREMVECLRQKSLTALITAAQKLGGESSASRLSYKIPVSPGIEHEKCGTADRDPLTIIPGPVVDRNFRSDPLLPELPEIILESGNFSRVPLIAGVTEDEMLIYIISIFSRNIEQIRRDPRYIEDKILPAAIQTTRNPIPLLDYTLDKLKKFYFKNVNFTSIEEVIPPFSEMLSDIMMMSGNDRMVKMYSKWAKVYMYVFEYRGSVSYLQSNYDMARRNHIYIPWMNTAVTHCEEMSYLVSSQNVQRFTQPDDQRMQEVMIQLWTTFAKYGSPNHPQSEEVLTLNHWNHFNTDSATYYRIGPYPHNAAYFRRFALDVYDDYYDHDYYCINDCSFDKDFYIATWVLMAISALLGAFLIVLVLLLVRNKRKRSYFSK